MQPETLGLLNDIREASGYIASDTANATLDEFTRDRRMRQLVERNFMVIGEAMNRMRRHDPETASNVRHFEQIIAFRNVLIHGYDVIEVANVWHIVEHYLATLVEDIDRLLSDDAARCGQ